MSFRLCHVITFDVYLDMRVMPWSMAEKSFLTWGQFLTYIPKLDFITIHNGYRNTNLSGTNLLPTVSVFWKSQLIFLATGLLAYSDTAYSDILLTLTFLGLIWIS